MMTLRIARTDPTIELPRYATDGAAGFDLAAAADIDVPPRGIGLVPTGLVIEVPPGWFLAIIARSSTPLRRGLIIPNAVGIVDSDYCGPSDEVKIQVWNIADRPVRVRRGDRLAQGLVLPAPRVAWEEIPVPGRPSRGGFGSTGA